MKVKELAAELAKLDPESEVILQKDQEGNGYQALRVVDPDAVHVKVEDSRWFGDVYSSHWSAADADMSEKEWADVLKNPRCVVLSP